MNLSLQDPFAVAKEYPDSLIQTFQYGHSTTFQFNKKGDYLASGTSDGSIVIYDLSINGVICLMESVHSRPITSLSWSSCGQYLLSTSQDWTCKLWDLNNCETPLKSILCDGPIWLGMINPNNSQEFVLSLFEDKPIYYRNEVVKLETEPEITKHLTLVSVFTPDGQYIFMGTNKGYLNIISTKDLKLVHLFKLANSNIKNLVISPNGRKLAVNSSDRIIRQIIVPDLINDDVENWEFEVEHKYQDVVNKLQWNSVSFNHNGEFLVASTFGTQSSQDLYIWETSMGSLIKILEGSSEELIEVKWNYPRCMIASNGIEYGIIYLWSVEFPQKWSALAPDFVEIEDNIEYQEKEDEFDIIDEDLLNKKRMEEEDLKVDIITTEKLDARGFDLTSKSFIIPINYEQSLAN